MEKLNLNELLRYYTIGLFFTFILLISIDKSNIKGYEKYLEIDYFLTISLVNGFIIYIFYRSFLYPMILNPLVVVLTNDKRKKAFPKFRTYNLKKIIIKTDLKRYELNNQKYDNVLKEWASQIHFLYNTSVSCFLLYILHQFFPKTIKNEINFLLIGIIFMTLSLLHHYRFKKMEIKFLKKSKKNINTKC